MHVLKKFISKKTPKYADVYIATSAATIVQYSDNVLVALLAVRIALI